MAYWATCLFFAIVAIAIQISKNSHATTSIRKIFHILAVIVYIPGFIWDSSFLYLASGVILVLFLALEVNTKFYMTKIVCLHRYLFIIFQ